MAVSYLDGDVVNYTGTPTTSFAFTVPAGTVQGDVFVISVASNTDDFTLTGPSGSTTLIAASQSTWGFCRTATYLYVVPSTVPSTLSVGASASVEGSIAWMRFRGVDPSNPLAGGPAVKALGSTSSTNQVAPTITTAVDGAYVIGGLNATSGSVGVTAPSGWTIRANGSRRKGILATKGVQTSAGSAGAATWTLAAANDAQAWQAALRPAGAEGGPEQVDGASTATLSAPADRWAKGTQRVMWRDSSAWRAVLPTSTGHRLFQLVEGGDAVQGAVVDSRQDARPTVVHHEGWTGVLRIHPTASRFTAYNSSYTATVTDASVPLTSADSDASPATLCRSANGYLWAAVDSGSSVLVTRSTDGGATWGAAQSVLTTTAATGVVSLVAAGTTVVLVVTENDGGGRHVRSISQAAGSYAAGSWATETLPALPSGTTSDDHLSTTVGLDGRVYAVAKLTNDELDTALFTLLVRSTGGAWTQYVAESAPDNDGGATPGYSRPSITIAYDKVVIAYGSIYDANVWTRSANLSDLSTWTSRSVVLTGPDYSDGAQLPEARHVRAAGGNYPVLAHERASDAISLAWLPSGVPAAPQVTYAIVGAPTADGFTVSTKVTSGQSVRVVSGSAFGSAATPDGDGWSKSTFTGLTPATTAVYDVEVTATDGWVTTISAVGQGKSLPTPGSAAGFTFGFGSCFDSLNGSLTSPNTGSFARLRARNPDMVFHLGDFTYADNSATTQASHRANLEQVLGYSPALQDLARDSAMVYVKSDHDAGGGNNSAPGAWTAGNRAAALQVFPYGERPNSNGLYHSFVVGRVRFIVTDTRYLVTSTSRLGTTQKAWFKDQLQQPEPVKVWVQEATWIDNEPAESGGDKWQDFPAEKSELGSFIETSAVGQVLTIHGDQHALSADDGTNNDWGGFPSFCAAPFRNYSSLKTLSMGDWSEGFYPASEGTEVAQYGFCTVTDSGESITLALRGYDTSNTLRVQMDVVVSTAAPEPGDGPKVKVGGAETAATWTVVQGGVEVPFTGWSIIQSGAEVALV